MTENSATTTDTLPPTAPERSENDELMDTLRPYLTQIGVAVILGLLALIAITLFINSRQQSASAPWQELTAAQSEFALGGNVDRLTQVASQHPDTPAAMQALQTAGDFQLRQGIDQLQTDRDKGFESIEKAKESYQQIIDAPSSAKSSAIQQSSVFSMAYASESLGQFDDAAKYYTQLIEEAPESHFADAAKRGVARSTNPDFVAAFKKFKEYEPLGDAPGPNVPTRPEIDFPEVDVPDDAAATSEVKTEDSDAEAEGDAKMEQPEVKAAPVTTDEEAPADPAKLNPAEANAKPGTSETTEATEAVENVEPATTEVIETADPATTESTVAPAVPESPTVSDVIEAVEEVVTPAAPSE